MKPIWPSRHSSPHHVAWLCRLRILVDRDHLAAIEQRLSTRSAPAHSRRNAVARRGPYLACFNGATGTGCAGCLADDVRLIQSSYPLRAGAGQRGHVFGVYSRSEPVRVCSCAVIAATRILSGKASYMMWLEWRDRPDRLHPDYKYVRYAHRRRGAGPGARRPASGRTRWPRQLRTHRSRHIARECAGAPSLRCQFRTCP